MFKKVIANLLFATMVLSLFACSSNATTQSTTAATTVSETTIAETTTETKPNELTLDILMEQDDSMRNIYTLLAVNDQAPFADVDGNAIKDVKINTKGADAFINWLLGEGADIADNYKYDEYKMHLFNKLDGAPKPASTIEPATDETRVIRLSTTTSVNDTGLLAEWQKKFKEEYGYEIEVYSAGTGKSIANSKLGNADLILVHAKAQEDKFVEEGFARKVDGFDQERLSFLYNYFVLCGPKDDPAHVREAATVQDAFKAIADGKFLFVSRGDNSGTHSKELSLWPKELGLTIEPSSFEKYSDWYISSNAGMGICLTQAAEKGAYILSDKATMSAFIAGGGVIKK